MGRKFNKKNKGGKQFKSRESINWTDIPRESEKWESYYKATGLIPEDEWPAFKKACQNNLPTTFRITGSRKHADEIKQLFIDKHVSTLKGQEFEGMSLEPTPLAYYPDQLGWQMEVSKGVVRKNPQFATTQRFLVVETEVGNISRQEAVSMIPPLLMDIKPDHAVLDMCAAPGSKTAQLVEALHANDEEANPTGFVLANDSDYKRSHMLVHQVKRLNSPNFLVVNHDAQLFPRIKLEGDDDYLKFDRILCDVPCSGDGTMRKNVNVWKDFTVSNALGLHKLQVNILERGLNLLKPGGRLVYSTCSLSPVENEAVVAAALRKWGDKIAVVDVSDELPGLKRRPGVSSWPVLGKDMEPREPGAADVAASVFPPSEEEAARFHLDRCMRVYPHLQNTGGFFITVFEKLDDKKREADEATAPAKAQKTDADATPAEAKEASATPAVTPAPEEKPKKVKMPRNANEEPFIMLPASDPELATCWPFYEFDDSFPRDCCLVRNATGEALRSIYYVAPVVRRILESPERKLKLVNAGIKIFVSQRNDSGRCAWRVQNEALHTIRRHIGPGRQVECGLPLLKQLFQEAFPKLEAIKEQGIDPEFAAKMEATDEGCVFLTVKREGYEDLFLPLWRGKSNLNLMVNKKDTQELLYRVYDIETSAKDQGKEAAYQQRMNELRENEGTDIAEPVLTDATEQESDATPQPQA
ncbi:multisite-specific tRNA:(cytosine-C(5))-methyltransferase [Diutina catenulata]